MAQTKKKQTGKKKPVRATKKAAKKKTARRPVKPKQKPKPRVSAKAVPRTRPAMKDKSLDAVSTQLQRIEKHVASLQSDVAESRKAKAPDIDVKIKAIERKLDSRLGRFDERLDSLRAHLLDLEERLEGETDSGPLHVRDLDEGMDDS